jgi:hypothetical protein
MAAYTRQVLALAKEGEYYEGDLPEEGVELSEQHIAEADYFVTEAIDAWATGMRDKHVGLMLVAAGEMTQDEFEADMAEGEVVSGPDPDLLEDQDPDYHGDEAPVKEARPEPNTAIKATSEEEDFMAANKLPIPQTIATEDNGLPADLTTLDDRVLRRYHSLYNGFLGRSRWLLGLATGELIRAEHLRDEALRVALLKVNRIDPKTEKPKSVATLDAEAKESADYQMWASAANQHERDVAMRKAVVDIYQGNVAVLSREWTMRTEEFERSK